MNNELVLVCCSGGFDSSMTLAITKLSEYKNIIACHFDYGSRSSTAEKLAITNVCKELDIPLKVFDLSHIYKDIDVNLISMLSNDDAAITTGTKNGVKTTQAWTPFRNGLFMSVMITLAESEVMKHDYDKVYFAGGFLQLTESSVYSDNTPYFVNACLEMAKYGTLVGNRFSILYGLSNLMKSEQFFLMNELSLQNVYRWTISCDRAKVFHIDNLPDNININAIPDGDLVACNCSYNKCAYCGSGLLSYWSSKMVGLNDMEIRNYYEVDDPNYEAYVPQHMKDGITKNPDINDVIDRILLPEDKLNNLRKLIKRKNKNGK